MSQLGVLLQESVDERGDTRSTILNLLCEQMNGSDRGGIRRSFKQRLGFKGMGCCGTTWGFGRTTVSVIDDEDAAYPENNIRDPVIATGMNLAAALAAQRQFWTAREPEEITTRVDDVELVRTGETAPLRVSLMRLLEETAESGGGGGRGVGVGVGSDTVCCVCMGRKKGAAFIPCGHTFCRVCSRELWLNRGTCPLCNRWILEILDIF